MTPSCRVSKTAYLKCFDCENEITCEIRRTLQMVRDAMAKVLNGTSLADAISIDSKVSGTLGYAFAQ
jgi:DNA-binding IscR family transcriptional regulator